MSIYDDASTKSLVVALIAVSRSMASVNPNYVKQLKEAIGSARRAGLDATDLQLLQFMITSAAAAMASQIDPPL